MLDTPNLHRCSMTPPIMCAAYQPVLRIALLASNAHQQPSPGRYWDHYIVARRVCGLSADENEAKAWSLAPVRTPVRLSGRTWSAAARDARGCLGVPEFGVELDRVVLLGPLPAEHDGSPAPPGTCRPARTPPLVHSRRRNRRQPGQNPAPVIGRKGTAVGSGSSLQR